MSHSHVCQFVVGSLGRSRGVLSPDKEACGSDAYGDPWPGRGCHGTTVVPVAASWSPSDVGPMLTASLWVARPPTLTS